MKTKILMVCLGNICRSPLAEGILKSKLNSNTDVLVDSAGTGNYHVGDPPDSRSVAIAKHYNLDITNQRGRLLTAEDLKEFDHIFVMDQFNYDDAIELAESDAEKAKVKLILEEIFPGENVDVPDPYHRGEQGFENVYQMLNEACDVISDKIQKGIY